VRRGRGDDGATASARANALQFLERGGLPLLLLLLIAFFALDPASGSVFRSSANVRNILGNQAVTAIVALAMVVPLVGGYFDLSVSAITGAANVAVAAVLGTHGWPIWAGVAFGIGLGAAIGLVNGFLVARLRLNGFVVTLGSYTLLLGIIQYYTDGQQIIAGIPDSFSAWGAATWLGIPRPFYVLLAIAIVTWYVLAHVPYGRFLEAIGSNESAAKLVGIPTERVVWTSFVISGTLAAAAGALQTCRSSAGDPTVASSLLFPALTAVFLGATMIRPGKYNVWGTVIGVFLVAVSVSGFTLLGATGWVQRVFDGGALIFAVALSTFMGRARERRASGGKSRTDVQMATLEPDEPPALIDRRRATADQRP
jgi:ribose transport system permease protein